MNKKNIEKIFLDEYNTFFIIYTKEGGMGKVSVGKIISENQDTDIWLAVKRIKNNNKVDIERFKKETNIWKSLKHPNIIKAFSFMKIDDEFCLFMEPILPDEYGRNTLADFLNDSLCLKQILEWSIQFCYAMIYLNSRGVTIHRDIKPSNIMISDNLLKVTDFGLSNYFNIKEKNYIHLSGTMMYQAPETFEGEYTIKSDIYSWGLVLYQMVNKGQLPYIIPNYITANSEEEFFKEIHNSYSLPKIESPLKRIIYKCLNKNPLKRYNTFKEILNDLIIIYEKLFNEKPYQPKIEELTFEERILQINTLIILDEIEEAKKLLDLIEENKETRPLLSHVYYQLGNLNKSLELYREIIIDEPNNYEVIYGYAKRLHESGNFLEAEIQYNKVLKIKSKDKKTLVNLGNLVRDMYSYDEALEYYDEVLEIDSNFFMAKFNKAITFVYMKKFDDAERIFNELKSDKRYNKKYKLIRAIETAKINEAKGSALLYNLKKEYPDDEDVLFHVGYFHFYYKRYGVCILELNKVLKINPKNEKVISIINEAKKLC